MDNKTKYVMSKKMIAIIIISVLLVAAIAIGLFFLLNGNKKQENDNSPEQVFKQAIEKGLSTKNYTTSQYMGDGEYRYVSNVDVEDVRKSRVYTQLDLSPESDRIFAKQAFSTIDELYYREAPSTRSQNTKSDWYRARSQNDDGKSSLGFLKDLEAYSYVFGQFIIGNYSEDNKSKIIAKIEELQPYSFDVNEVKTEDINGEVVYVYTVKANVDKVVALNRYVASLLNVNAPTWEYMISEKVVERKFYITKDQPRLVKITEVYGVWKSFEEAKKYDSTRVITYEDFDRTDVVTLDKLKLGAR